jgi:hypothetical protein
MFSGRMDARGDQDDSEAAKVEHSMSGPEGQGGGAGSTTSPQAAHEGDPSRLAAELDDCRRRCDKLADRERRIAELLNSKNPDKIEHDLRNVMNELQLLRTLFEKQGG